MKLSSNIESKPYTVILLKILGLLFVYSSLWFLLVFYRGPAQSALQWIMEPCKSKQASIAPDRVCPHPILQFIFHFW